MSFKKLIQTAKQGQAEREESSLLEPQTALEIEATSTPTRQRSRPLAKRSNPDYAQALAYIPKNLHIKIRQELMNPQYGKKDFSDLVAELLTKWLEEKT